MFEKTQPHLNPKNAPHGFVNLSGGELTVPQQLSAVLSIEPADHLHIDASAESEARGFTLVCRQAVLHKFFNRGVIADDEAIEFPFAAQYLRQCEWIRGSRYTVEIVEGAHESADARVDGCL